MIWVNKVTSDNILSIENTVPRWLIPENSNAVILPNRMRITNVIDDSELAVVRKYWKEELPRACIEHIIDHSPILTKEFKTALKAKTITMVEVVERQRLKDIDGDWYVDEYGLYVYAVPVLSIDGSEKEENRIL